MGIIDLELFRLMADPRNAGKISKARPKGSEANFRKGFRIKPGTVQGEGVTEHSIKTDLDRGMCPIGLQSGTPGKLK